MREPPTCLGREAYRTSDGVTQYNTIQYNTITFIFYYYVQMCVEGLAVNADTVATLHVMLHSVNKYVST